MKGCLIVDEMNSSPRVNTDFTGRPGRPGGFALATDGDYLYFTLENDVGDLWVMDVVGE